MMPLSLQFILVLGVGWLAPLAACAEDWPHWRGARRDDVVHDDSGYRNGKWLTSKPLWTALVGAGASSPLVVGNCLYSIGWRDGHDYVVCLDVSNGQRRWEQSYKSPQYGRHALGDEAFYAGPSSTPEFDRDWGRLYTLGIDGDLRCWDVRGKGELIWRRNLYEEYATPRRPRVGRSGHRDYGYTSSPLVLGDSLIVEVGAPSGNLVGLDKHTGTSLWMSQAKDPPGHNSGPAPITVEGVPCVAVHTFDGLLVVRVDRGHEGQTIATYPWKTDFANNIASVAIHGSDVLLTSSYNHHKIARLRITLHGAEKVWQQDAASQVCTPVVHKGHVYWAWQELVCLDYETGERKWSGGRFSDPGSCVVTADDRLIIWSNQGDLTLTETATRSPAAFKVVAQRTGLGRSDAWPHVVLANRRLYCKDRSGQLLCFGLERDH